MKKLCYVILFLILSSCGKYGEMLNYVLDAKKTFKDKEWINYEVVLSQCYDGMSHDAIVFTVYSNCGKENPYYVIRDTVRMQSVKVESGKVLAVDEMNHELSCFQVSDDDSLGWWAEQVKNEVDSQLSYLSFYFLTLPKEVMPSFRLQSIRESKDTLCGNIPVKKYVALHSPSLMLNRETNEFDIPFQYESVIWRNLNTKLVDSTVR